jgi:hypothetical protein
VNFKAGGAEQRRNASLLLSTTGAAVAGIGLGALLGDALRPEAVAILVMGIFAHLVGMIGNRRAQLSTGYHFRWWEVGAYWLCWALIAAFGAYMAISLVRPA